MTIGAMERFWLLYERKNLDRDIWWQFSFITFQDRRYVFAHTLAPTTERLARLLELIDLSKGYIFLHILEKDYPAILEALKLQNMKIEKDLTFLYYHLPQAKALEYDNR